MTSPISEQLQSVGAAQTAKQRREATWELAIHCRELIVDAPRLAAYLAHHRADAEAMNQSLGMYAVQIARMEFLLGWMAEGGIHDSDGWAWENLGRRGHNRGLFPDHYQEHMRTYGYDGKDDPTGAAWCTTFVGFVYSNLGFAFNSKAKKNIARSPFWSGYRLKTWIEKGTSNSDVPLTAKGHRVADAETSGFIIEPSAWRDLCQTLKNSDQEQRRAALSEFFAAHPEPAPGDIMILGKDGNKFGASGHSHTTMVEQFDRERFVIATVEGNFKNAVRGRFFDLSEPDVVTEIVYLTRLGYEQFDVDVSEAGEATEALPPSLDELLSPPAALVAELAGFMIESQWVIGNDAGALVAEFLGIKRPS